MRDLTPASGSEATGVMSETEARDLCAAALHDTLAALRSAGNAGATYDAVGRRVGVPRQNVNEWCSPAYERAPKLVKVVLMGPTIAPAVLRAVAAKIEARPGSRRDLRDAALGVQEAAGGLARCVREVLADGKIDDDEDRALEAALLAAEAEIAAVRAARAQHRVRSTR